jgi:hypothetical protein
MKLVPTLTAGILALAMSGVVLAQQDQGGAANQPSTQQPSDTAPRSDTAPGTDTTGDAAQREQEYLAALKKCEPMTGNDKQKCIDKAKKKYNQM